MTSRRIYFDNAATTRCDARVLEAMLPYFTDRFGNPASRVHPFGWEAEEAVEQAREHVAGVLGADPREILFTSGATEANNLALRGVLQAAGVAGSHLITSAIEHSAILDPAAALESEGVAVTRLLPSSDGYVDPAQVAQSIRPETALVSVMHANNEIGALQDLTAIARVCGERGVLFHTDATQSFGKVPLSVGDMGIDLLSCSAHKINGPKGVGALYARRTGRKARLAPQILGGGQEQGLRSGTLNVPGIVGFGHAAALSASLMPGESARVAGLRDRLEDGLMQGTRDVWRNGGAEPRSPGITNLHFAGIVGESLFLAVPQVAFSGGSACASASLEPSHVLLALGHTPERARNSFRFSLGRFNTAEEVDWVIQDVLRAVGRLRQEAGTVH